MDFLGIKNLYTTIGAKHLDSTKALAMIVIIGIMGFGESMMEKTTHGRLRLPILNSTFHCENPNGGQRMILKVRRNAPSRVQATPQPNEAKSFVM